MKISLCGVKHYCDEDEKNFLEGANMTVWTRLEGLKIWSQAVSAHDIPSGRNYHNMNHVRRLYHHAEVTFGLPYCEDLDYAILGHDVVYNGRHEDVQDSVLWLRDRGKLNAKRESLIMSTLTHDLGADNRLIMLDLADFIYPRISIKNTELLMRESFILKRQSREAFLQGTISYLDDLSRRLLSGVREIRNKDEIRAFRRICGGISIISLEARHQLRDIDFQSEIEKKSGALSLSI